METRLESKIRASLVDGYLPCSVAFEVAREQKVAPKAVGDVANRLGKRIINCQLGCFKLEKAKPVEFESEAINETVAGEIKSSLLEGRLPCAGAFKVGRKLGVSLKEIGDTATWLKIKISACQLGCFP
ncbi:MAG: hypothetical protein Q8O55_03565 [Dehalococcoidales bacterium]|nr:hypothetical protein [Dehalococcoidales bacterium]